MYFNDKIFKINQYWKHKIAWLYNIFRVYQQEWEPRILGTDFSGIADLKQWSPQPLFLFHCTI